MDTPKRHDDVATLALTELTVEGLALVAAEQGLSLATAVRYLGLAGGGPDRPLGARRKLLQDLAHTLGADAPFVSLVRTARELAEAGSDDALVEWRSAAACARSHVRPDGYGLYRHHGKFYGFFLEYDRGTMSARDYLKKFVAHDDYRASGRFARDYEGFPTILVVATNALAEARIARVARLVATRYGSPLPLLLTTEAHIVDDPRGLLGPVWREPWGDGDGRRRWPLGPPACQGLQLHTREDCFLVRPPDRQLAPSARDAAEPSLGLTENDLPWQSHEEIGRVE